MRGSDQHLSSQEIQELAGFSADALPDSLEDAMHHVGSCDECRLRMLLSDELGLPSFSKTQSAPHARTPACPPDNTWLQVGAGLASPDESRRQIQHASVCKRCGQLLRIATEDLAVELSSEEEEKVAALASALPDWQSDLAKRIARGVPGNSQPRQRFVPRHSVLLWPRWAFAAAALVLVAIGAWWSWTRTRPQYANKLLAEAYTERRTIEVRIAGARYAPMRVERGSQRSSLDRPQQLLKAESLIGENLRRHPDDPLWLQAKARADLLDGNFESAIKSLRRAMEVQHDSPPLMIDIASAYIESAEANASNDDKLASQDYGAAVQYLGRALQLSPGNPIALFNQAIAAERLSLFIQAEDDLQQYLRIDPNSEWAGEARVRLADVQAKMKKHASQMFQPLLTPAELSVATREAPEWRAEIGSRIEEYLYVAVADWLPKAYPLKVDATTNAESFQSALRLIADIAYRDYEDRWLTDVLHDRSSPIFPRAVEELANALKENEIGNTVVAQRHAAEADRLFSSLPNSAGALRARLEGIFASHVAQEGTNCLQRARTLEYLVGTHSYRWLQIQFNLERGTCSWVMGNLGEARRSYERAAQAANAKAGTKAYSAIYLRSQDHLAGLEGASGNLRTAWATSERALDRFWAGVYPPVRGYNLYYNLYEFSRISKQPQLQLAVWREGVALSRSLKNNVLRAMAHCLMSDAAALSGSPQTAEKELTEADGFFAVAPQIASTRVARIEAETRLAGVETGLGKPEQAAKRLASLKPEVERLSDNFLAILFFSSLSEAEFRLGDDQQAISSLYSAIRLSELHLQSLHDDQSRVEWLEKTTGPYKSLVQWTLDQEVRKGDATGVRALEIWEWYRAAALRAGAASWNVSNQSEIEQSSGDHGRSGQSLEETYFDGLHEVAYASRSITAETVVTYAVLPKGLAIWEYDDRGVTMHWVASSAEDLAVDARNLVRLCSDPESDISDTHRIGRRLYDILIAPIEDRLSSNRALLIEADQALAGLPFDVLMDHNGRYLADRVTSIASLGLYYREILRRSFAITPDVPVLIVAVPASTANLDNPSPLPDAKQEAALVAGHFTSSRMLVGADATIEAVSPRLADATVFHFVGHAIVSVEQSGLLLQDALLRASSLRKTDLSHVQLAVLSACETQGDPDSSSFESDSLVRAFLVAGAPHVVASRWRVDSSTTRQVMELFYDGLLAGDSVPIALRKAQATLRAGPGTAHPYYWAAFVPLGSM